MKILIVHNHYVYSGGEDEVVEAEKNMLEKFGHKVILYEQSNSQINERTVLDKLLFAFKEIYWSKKTYSDILGIIKKEQPDVAHFHNTFFSISPSAYDACYHAGIPIIQTLHNYRFLCPTGLFYRNGQICEDCLRNGKKAAVINRCWRNSYFFSLVLTKIVRGFEKRKILSEKISHFIALTPFSRQKFIDNGFDEEKITIKPNFFDFESKLSQGDGKYGIFVGALRDYKGLATLMKAWKSLENNFSLKIIGDGPLYHELKKGCHNMEIELLGAKSSNETLQFIKESLFVVVPSDCYENFPRVILEAFACGVPVITTNHGALKDIVDHEKTGLLFKRASSDDLAEKINLLIESPTLARELGRSARKKYEADYTIEKNYQTLMDIYNFSINSPTAPQVDFLKVPKRQIC